MVRGRNEELSGKGKTGNKARGTRTGNRNGERLGERPRSESEENIKELACERRHTREGGP